MKVARLSVLFVLIALAGCGNETISTATEEAAIRAQGAKWLERVAAKDAKAIAQIYAEDGAMLIPNMPKVTGRQAIEAGWAEFFKTGMSSRFETERLVVAKGGDMAMEIGTFKNFKGEGTTAQTIEQGKYVYVWVKRDGTWLVQLDSFSSDAPPPASVSEPTPTSTP